MSGYILKTKADEILEEGLQKGRQMERQEILVLMNHLLNNGRIDDAKKASSDGDYLDALLAEFGITSAERFRT